jgi:hypothetical protein
VRKPSCDRGFFLCFALNLFYRAWWGGLGALLWLLRFRLNMIPRFLPLVPVGLWLLTALVATLFLSWAARAPGEPGPPRPNKNPYSAKNEDVFPSSDSRH